MVLLDWFLLPVGLLVFVLLSAGWVYSVWERVQLELEVRKELEAADMELARVERESELAAEASRQEAEKVRWLKEG